MTFLLSGKPIILKAETHLLVSEDRFTGIATGLECVILTSPGESWWEVFREHPTLQRPTLVRPKTTPTGSATFGCCARALCVCPWLSGEGMLVVRDSLVGINAGAGGHMPCWV